MDKLFKMFQNLFAVLIELCAVVFNIGIGF